MMRAVGGLRRLKRATEGYEKISAAAKRGDVPLLSPAPVIVAVREHKPSVASLVRQSSSSKSRFGKHEAQRGVFRKPTKLLCPVQSTG